MTQTVCVCMCVGKGGASGTHFLVKLSATDRYTFWKYLICPLSLIPVNSLHGLRNVLLKSCTVGLHIQEFTQSCPTDCFSDEGRGDLRFEV